MNHSSRPLLLVTFAFALVGLAGCASAPPPASSLPADAWNPPGSIEMSFASREVRPAVLGHELNLPAALRPNAPTFERHQLLRAAR